MRRLVILASLTVSLKMDNVSYVNQDLKTVSIVKKKSIKFIVEFVLMDIILVTKIYVFQMKRIVKGMWLELVKFVNLDIS
jgi:hypothetical protein